MPGGGVISRPADAAAALLPSSVERSDEHVAQSADEENGARTDAHAIGMETSSLAKAASVAAAIGASVLAAGVVGLQLLEGETVVAVVAAGLARWPPHGGVEPSITCVG
jgi:hypothetical protein